MSNPNPSQKVLSVEERWEQGIPHEDESVKLFESIRKIDEQHGGDYFDFKAGGDGDNGEHLMFLMDIHFNPTNKPKPVYKPCPERPKKGERWSSCDGTCSDLACDAGK